MLPLFVSMVASACAKDSELSEVSGGGNADEGPKPTAPPLGNDNAASGQAGLTGSVDANELIRRIDDLATETDLCKLLTGSALSDITSSDINLTSIMSNPAGFTQFFAALDRLFGHMGDIAPAEAKPSLAVLKSAWSGMAKFDPRAPDAQTRMNALVASPETQQAQKDLEAWVRSACAGQILGQLTTTTAKR